MRPTIKLICESLVLVAAIGVLYGCMIVLGAAVDALPTTGLGGRPPA